MTAIPMPPQPQQFGPMWRALRDRLSTLELQIAQFGEYAAPTHMLVERDNLQIELAMIERANEPQPSKELYAAVDDHIRHHALMSAVMALSGRVYEVQAAERRLHEQLDRFQGRLLWLLPSAVVVVMIVAEVLARL